MDAVIKDKADSAREKPPPPPFEENIANNDIIENSNGEVYYYSFIKKPPLCGYMTENGKYKFELYARDLDTLKASSLRKVKANNIDSIVHAITNAEKPIYVSIGIQNDTSTNEILIMFVNTLYKNSCDNRWKVRKVANKENKLLTQLSAEVATNY